MVASWRGVGVEGVVEAVEDPRRTDDLVQVVALEVRSAIALQTSDAELNACLGEIFFELLDDARCAVVDIGNGFGVDDKPAYGGGRGTDQSHYLVGETAGIGVEERGTESI